ncbi:MAG: BlaI/MecI/CopY family transcriptional regulator [Clostridium sp.]|uniref:BlaI/MecI/CopY family transcriptional regulator n=1 Tax=Clostridium sp. TaxID=1506 RepID=UPI00306F5435
MGIIINKKIKRLPDSELDIMLIIWDAGRPVSRAYIEKQINEKKDLAPTTILSLLTRLIDKGFVCSEKQGKSNIFSAIVDENDYLQNEGKSILEKLYGNSLKNFVAALYQGDHIDETQLSDLRDFLDKTKEGK